MIFFINYFNGKKYARIEGSAGLIIKIINEDRRKKIEVFFDNLFNDEDCFYAGRLISKKVKEKLMQYLYPTREERLEQDIDIFYSGDDPDCYISNFGSSGKLFLRERNRSFKIKILNKENKEYIMKSLYKIFDILNTQYEFKKNADRGRGIEDVLSLSIPLFKEILISLLYPTREEQFEQDISWVTLSKLETIQKENQFYICRLGDVGYISKSPKYSSDLIININNESILLKFEQSLDKIKELLQKHHSTGKSSGGSMHINNYAVKEVLINVLYDDPEFSDFYDYPENTKPVHIERAIYPKPLIPIEYIEPFVKNVQETKKATALALF